MMGGGPGGTAVLSNYRVQPISHIHVVVVVVFLSTKHNEYDKPRLHDDPAPNNTEGVLIIVITVNFRIGLVIIVLIIDSACF